jgi:hypothetical protein
VKLVTVWLVRDPTTRSTLEDILWEQEVARLDRYILGSPTNAWTSENHAVYATREEAEEDARARFAKMRERLAQMGRDGR